MNYKPTLFLFFSLGICFLANAQIVNKGVLKISSGANVTFLDEYTNTDTGNHISNGNLYLHNNFINHGETSATSGITYFKSATNNLLTLSGASNEANFYNLEIDVTALDKKGLSVADDFGLQVNNALHLKNGDLRLIGESQLIQSRLGANNNTIGSGKLLKDQQGHVSSYQFNYWSSPVNNGGTFSLLGGKFDGTDSALKPFDPAQILFNTGAPHNGLPSTIDGSGYVTTPLTINKRWLYKFARGSGSYNDWIRINPSTGLLPGEGYTMKGPNSIMAEQNYVYYGTPNNGSYQFEITTGEEVLLGNPYPSAIDAVKFIEDNETVVDALYFWVDGGSTNHNLSDYLGGYAIRNKTGGTTPSIHSSLIAGIGTSGTVTPPTKYVPVGQGFFIAAIGTGTIEFNNGQRIFKTEKANESIFYRNIEETTSSSNAYLRIGHEGPEGFHKQMLLGFLPDSTADLSFNPGYDALQMTTRVDDAFFIIENNPNKRYVIQGVNSFFDAMEFPIGITISASGSHRLMLDAVENFNETIYLKDEVLNETYDLSNSEHEINLPPGEYLDRFSIVFKPAETLTVETSALDKATVFYDGHDHIVVANITNLEINSIDVFNMLGQRVLTVSENLNSQTKIQIPFAESHGVYLVVLNTATNKKSSKILKY
ncbi:MAG TPA: T9SS sorting signal type C domain-containing protein [Xanthomarina sp.]|nr:T9SS sorting signal type C domain-containing protein [Xanthomarina sp.]